MRKKKSHDALEIHDAELNLVPYMDIMVNLIMFMIVSTTSFVQMKIINVSVPAMGEASENKPDENKEELLPVVLMIGHKQGFLISVNGNYLEDTPKGEPTVKVLSDGKFDYATLTQKMEIVKAKQPKNDAVTIVADADVDYETLVKTMDAIRYESEKSAVGGERKLLFPNVLLGVQ